MHTGDIRISELWSTLLLWGSMKLMSLSFGDLVLLMCTLFSWLSVGRELVIQGHEFQVGHSFEHLLVSNRGPGCSSVEDHLDICIHL